MEIKRAKIREVITRDGIQSLKDFIPTEVKVDLINRLSACGFESIEVSSFVHPKWVPQLKDAAAVFGGIERREGAEYLALVPNLKGVERAILAGADGVGITMSASETHNYKNLHMTREESFAQIEESFKKASAHHLEMVGGIATAFGCPMEGVVPYEELEWAVSRYSEIGIKTIRVSDTTGMANPRQVKRTMILLQESFPHLYFGLHFHDTRGMGLANVLAGLEAGIDFFDGSLCGLGGCPYAPGATGNIDTIDLAHMLEEMGISTGIDLDQLIELGRYVEEIMGKKLYSSVLLAGTVRDLISPDTVATPG